MKKSGMCCPDCGGFQTHVRRTEQKTGYVWRRRVCKGCGNLFTTAERHMNRSAPEIEDDVASVGVRIAEFLNQHDLLKDRDKR